MSEERKVKAVVARDANPVKTAGKENPVCLRVLGVVDLLKQHSPDHVVIEVDLNGLEPTLANGHKLISASRIVSAGTCYEE